MRRTLRLTLGGVAVSGALIGCVDAPPCETNADCADGYTCIVGETAGACVPDDDEKPPITDEDAGPDVEPPVEDAGPDVEPPDDERDAGPDVEPPDDEGDAGPDIEPPDDEGDAGPDVGEPDAGPPPPPPFEGLRLRGELTPGFDVSTGDGLVLKSKLGRPFAARPLSSSSFRLRLRPEALH